MGLQCGIIGLPNVGKSTLFNCMSSAKAQVANFPFCTIESNVGIIPVPDNRLTTLEKLVKPEKVVPATIEIVDIAGLVKGASKGEGLGNKFLDNIRNTDAIIHALRCFDNDNVSHIDETISPVRDKEIVDMELQLKDLETVENRIQKVQNQAKSGEKDAQKTLEILHQYKEILGTGKPARLLKLEKHIDDLHLLTDRPVLYLCNVDEASVVSGNKYTNAFKEAVKDENAELLIIAAQAEADIAELDKYEERQMFLEDLGLSEPGVNKLIKSAYKLLNLETFFTTVNKELKAWTYEKGILAPQAAGIIHTDFEKGFIKAEVIKYDDYIKFGSEQTCRETGKIAVEGKEYIVQDGDVIHFKFNV